MRLSGCSAPSDLRSLQNYAECASNQTVNLKSCQTQGAYYSRIRKMCTSDTQSRVLTYDDSANTAVATIQLSIVKGYNFFGVNDFNDVQLKPGDIFRLTQTGVGKVALDRSATNSNPENDYWLDQSFPTTKQTGNFLSLRSNLIFLNLTNN